MTNNKTNPSDMREASNTGKSYVLKCKCGWTSSAEPFSVRCEKCDTDTKSTKPAIVYDEGAETIWKKYPDDIPDKYEVRNHDVLLVHKNKGIMYDQLQWDGEDKCYHLREYEFHRSKIKEGFTHWCYESDLIASITQEK